MKPNINVCMISESKIGNSFPLPGFYISGYKIFLRPNLSHGEQRNGCFLRALCLQIIRRRNLKIATKRLLHQACPCSCLWWCGYSRDSWVSSFTTDRIFSESRKNYFKGWFFMNSAYFSDFYIIHDLIKGPHHQKYINQLTLNHTTF